MDNVVVYGADWCVMTRRTLAHLDQVGVEYRYIDVEEDPKASEWVKQQSDGREKKPTLDIGGTVLVEPSNGELDDVLRSKGLLKSVSS